MFELKELARPVCRFAERHDARVADDSLERLEVGEVAARSTVARRIAWRRTQSTGDSFCCASSAGIARPTRAQTRNSRQGFIFFKSRGYGPTKYPDLAVISPPPFLSRTLNACHPGRRGREGENDSR